MDWHGLAPVMTEMSDAEVFGTGSSKKGEMSDADVFGNASADIGENRAGVTSALRGIPVLGAYTDKGVAALNAALQPVISGGLSEAPTFSERYNENLPRISAGANQYELEHPIASTVGQLGAGAAALAPVGTTALGARALGLGGQTVLGMAGRGAASAGAIGAADTAARGGDIGTGALTSALIGGALPVAGNAIARAISPGVANAGRQTLVDTLANEGIGVTAGQRAGSKAIQYAESTLGDFPGAGGQATKAMENQGRQLSEAAVRRFGATDATRQAVDTQAANLENNFQTLSQRNNLTLDKQLGRDVGEVLNRYDRKLPSQQREVVNNYVNDIFAYHGTDMPGTVYQTARSDLSRQANAARNSDPTFSDALRGLRNALDNAMGRSISPADQALWQKTRQQYGNFKTLENAMKNTDASGNVRITPAALVQAASSQNKGQFARGKGDFAQLAQAAQSIMQPLPQSGTTPRAVVAALPAALTAATLNPAHLLGLIGPVLAGRAIMTRPAQAYLGNQVAQHLAPVGGILQLGSRALPSTLDEHRTRQ